MGQFGKEEESPGRYGKLGLCGETPNAFPVDVKRSNFITDDRFDSTHT